MKKLLFLVLVIALLTAGVIFGIPLIVNSGQLREQVITEITKATGVTPEIKGNIKVVSLPFPKAIIYDVTLGKKNANFALPLATIPSLELGISPLSMISGKVEVESITLVKPVIHVEIADNGAWNWNLQNDGKGAAVDDAAFRIYRGTLKFIDQASNASAIIERLTADVDIESITGPFTIKGDFLYNGNKYTINSYTGNFAQGKSDIKWKLGSDLFTFQLAGNIQGDAKSPVIDATFNASGKDIAALISKYADIERDDTNDVVDNKFEFKGTIHRQGDSMEIKDITLDSENIIGKGNVVTHIGRQSISDAVFSFDYINLDQLFGNNGSAFPDFSRLILPSTGILSDITIKELRHNFDMAQNIHIVSQLIGGDLEVTSLTADLPGKSNLVVSGLLSRNNDLQLGDAVTIAPKGASTEEETVNLQNTLPTFKGTFSLYGENLAKIVNWMGINTSLVQDGKLGVFQSQGTLRLAPHIVELDDIRARVDGSVVESKIRYRHGVGRPKLSMRTDINTLNLYDYLKKDDGPDSTTQDFLWLRKINADYDLEAHIANLIINNYTLKNVSTLLSLNPTALILEHFRVKSDLTDLTARVALDITELKPKLSVSIDANHIDTSVFDIPATPAIQNTDAQATSDSPPLQWPLPVGHQNHLILLGWEFLMAHLLFISNLSYIKGYRLRTWYLKVPLNKAPLPWTNL